MKSSRALSIGLSLLVLACTGAAWGQEGSGEEPARLPASELTPPPLIPVPAPGSDRPSRAQPPPEDVSAREPAKQAAAPVPSRASALPEDPVPRIAVEVVGGAAGGIIAGTVGLVTGYVVALPTVGCDECRVVSLVGGLTGVLLGIPSGTWMGGRLMGGRGTLLATAGGSLVGWCGALLGSILLGDSGDSDALSLALLAMPVAGATVGYELSRPSSAPATPPAVSRPSQVHLVPVAGMTEHGARLGLMGRF